MKLFTISLLQGKTCHQLFLWFLPSGALESKLPEKLRRIKAIRITLLLLFPPLYYLPQFVSFQVFKNRTQTVRLVLKMSNICCILSDICAVRAQHSAIRSQKIHLLILSHYLCFLIPLMRRLYAFGDTFRFISSWPRILAENFSKPSFSRWVILHS